jgi:hypothetical protein
MGNTESTGKMKKRSMLLYFLPFPHAPRVPRGLSPNEEPVWNYVCRTHPQVASDKGYGSNDE